MTVIPKGVKTGGIAEWESNAANANTLAYLASMAVYVTTTSIRSRICFHDVLGQNNSIPDPLFGILYARYFDFMINRWRWTALFPRFPDMKGVGGIRDDRKASTDVTTAVWLYIPTICTIFCPTCELSGQLIYMPLEDTKSTLLGDSLERRYPSSTFSFLLVIAASLLAWWKDFSAMAYTISARNGCPKVWVGSGIPIKVLQLAEFFEAKSNECKCLSSSTQWYSMFCQEAVCSSKRAKLPRAERSIGWTASGCA